VRIEDTFFVSYSRRDQEFVLRLGGDLRAAGSQIWVDQIDIRPGDHWDRAVERALRDCVGMLLILSRSSVASENVLDEVTIALQAGKPVIPVRIEPCNLPLRLARVQFIDAAGDYAEGLKRCSAAMITARKAIGPVPSAAQELPVLSPEVAAKLCALLTRFMGPISKNLVREESQRVASIQELSLRLAALIPEEKERALFIASVRAI
jgi:TIR domain-containing protein